MAKDIKFNIIDDNFRILSLCLYFCGRVGVLLAPFHFAAHSHSLPRAVLHEFRRMCQAAPVFPVPKLPVPEQGLCPVSSDTKNA